MFKLYPANYSKAIEIGVINSNNIFVRINANEATNGTGRQQIVNFALPTETGNDFGEWLTSLNLTSDNDTAKVEMFLDSAHKETAGIGIIVKRYGSSTVLSRYDISFIFLRGMQRTDTFDYIFSKFSVSSAFIESDNPKVQLASMYATDDDLSQKGHIRAFIKNMIKMERDMEAGTSAYKGKNLGFSPLCSPFVPIFNELISFEYIPSRIYFSTSPQFGGRCFINSATMWYMFTGKKILNPDEMTIGSLKFRPAISYSPSAIDTSSMKYFYDSGVIPSSNYRKAAVEINFSDSNPKFSITENTLCELHFLQIPDFIFNERDFIDNATSGNYDITAFEVTIRAGCQKTNKFNFFFRYRNSRALGLDFFVQIKDSHNMSRVCSELGDKTDLSNISKNEDYIVPAFEVATLTPSEKPYDWSGTATITMGTSSGNGIFTGTDALNFFYGGEVQTPGEEIPDYEIPPDDGNGGITDDDGAGGDGTWQDDDDNTSPWDGDPMNDPTAPMPPALGLDGNYKLLHMSRSALYSLAQQSWFDGGWLKFLSTQQGSSKIGEGVVDVKACFIDIPKSGDFSLTNIAGYEITTPIECTVPKQYTQFSFGSLSIPKYFDSYLDFAPYTEFTLELPFASPIKIPPESIVGDILKVNLRVDSLSGTALYLIGNSTHLIAQVPADVFVSIPFGTSEWSESRAQAVFELISGITTGATVGSQIGGITGAVAGGVIGLTKGVTDKNNQRHATQISDGGSPSATGAMGIKKAILKVSRPYIQIPTQFYEMNGCPSCYIKRVSELSGYFEGKLAYGRIPCNEDEYAEIERVLAEGVFPR